MNKSKGNMYGFVTHTWNPICGHCEHGCEYCYMSRWKLKPVHLNEAVLKENLGSDRFIFVGSGTDMFAKNVNYEWIKKVLSRCEEFDNKYLFQSKNPANMQFFPLPEKSIIATTIESNRSYPEMGNAPSIEERVLAMQRISERGTETMITIEPIMDFDVEELLDIIIRINPSQVNIGADSKASSLTEPEFDKIMELVSRFPSSVKIVEKSNLERLKIG